SDCPSGLTCIWDSVAGGVCSAVLENVCSGLLTTGGNCDVCVENNCCGEYEACAADVTCGRDYVACDLAGTCAAKLVGSSDGAESALGSCIDSLCGGYCF
ncbi:MAG: hypothetical protein FWD17_10025, partial [Polyangiaceae bacterium]|nr:hypothetical protein [Polyangiaceae bacterium]